MKRRATTDKADAATPTPKRGRYKQYEYRDAGQNLPRRTAYDIHNPLPKRPPKSAQQRTTTSSSKAKQKHASSEKRNSSSLALLPPSENQSTERFETECMSPSVVAEEELGKLSENSQENEECDVWELAEDIDINTIINNDQEDFPELNLERPEEDECDENDDNDPNDPSDDSEPEEELNEASNLNISVAEKIQMMLLLATKKRHQLSYSAAECIMKLAGVVSQTDSAFTPSKHLMKRAIKLYSAGLSEHHLCPKCSFYHGPAEEVFTCSECGEDVSVALNKSNCFLYLSISEQLKFMLESGLLDNLISPQKRKKISPGSYEDIYDGKLYKEKVSSDPDCISLNFFVDGVQIASTSKNAGWPVLLCVNELPLKLRRKHVIMACVWVSKKKPNMNEYLKPLVKEFNELSTVGITVNSHHNIRRIRVVPLTCICDSVARPLLRNSSQFNGEFGCGLCYHPGFCLKRGRGYARSYSIYEREYPLRTHEETMNLARTATADEPNQGIKGVSILTEIKDFDIIQCLDLDLFHALVNTAKRFANLWLHTRYSGKQFNVKNKIGVLNRRLLAIKITDDISRAPRSLLERSDWRGHEWFNWIIFYSIPVMKDVLPSRYLNHWALLVHGIVLLMQNSVAKSELHYASMYLRQFNVAIDHLYGKVHVTFSCHLLTHLGTSVKNFAQPWSHSAFMFESFLCQLKNAVKSGNGVAHQISMYMELLIALPKMKKDLWYAMNDRDKKYLESVTVFKPYAEPDLVLGSIAFLGQPCYTKLSADSYRALRTSGFDCDQEREYPIYLRCTVDNEIFHSRNYSKATKTDNSVVLLESNEVFQTDVFIVIDSIGLALGHFLVQDSKKICSVNLPHMRVFEETNEGRLRCVPISNFQSKLISFSVDLTNDVLRLGCISVLKLEMLI